jgi:hypothetical protein
MDDYKDEISNNIENKLDLTQIENSLNKVFPEIDDIINNEDSALSYVKQRVSPVEDSSIAKISSNNIIPNKDNDEFKYESISIINSQRSNTSTNFIENNPLRQDKSHGTYEDLNIHAKNQHSKGKNILSIKRQSVTQLNATHKGSISARTSVKINHEYQEVIEEYKKILLYPVPGFVLLAKNSLDGVTLYINICSHPAIKTSTDSEIIFISSSCIQRVLKQKEKEEMYEVINNNLNLDHKDFNLFSGIEQSNDLDGNVIDFILDSEIIENSINNQGFKDFVVSKILSYITTTSCFENVISIDNRNLFQIDIFDDVIGMLLPIKITKGILISLNSEYLETYFIKSPVNTNKEIETTKEVTPLKLNNNKKNDSVGESSTEEKDATESIENKFIDEEKVRIHHKELAEEEETEILLRIKLIELEEEKRFEASQRADELKLGQEIEKENLERISQQYKEESEILQAINNSEELKLDQEKEEMKISEELKLKKDVENLNLIELEYKEERAKLQDIQRDEELKLEQEKVNLKRSEQIEIEKNYKNLKQKQIEEEEQRLEDEAFAKLEEMKRKKNQERKENFERESIAHDALFHMKSLSNDLLLRESLYKNDEFDKRDVVLSSSHMTEDETDNILIEKKRIEKELKCKEDENILEHENELAKIQNLISSTDYNNNNSEQDEVVNKPVFKTNSSQSIRSSIAFTAPALDTNVISIIPDPGVVIKVIKYLFIFFSKYFFTYDFILIDRQKILLMNQNYLLILCIMI